MAVDLPAPRLIRRRIAEDADPIEPLAVFLGLAGDLQRVLVEPHDVASATVSRIAHAFAQQGQCGFALIVTQIGEADAVTHHPRMDVAPHPPRLVADGETCRVALRRAERGEESARGLQHGRERDAGLLDREHARCELAVGGNAVERLGKSGVGPFTHRLQPRRQFEWPDRRCRRPVPQAEMR